MMNTTNQSTEPCAAAADQDPFPQSTDSDMMDLQTMMSQLFAKQTADNNTFQQQMLQLTSRGFLEAGERTFAVESRTGILEDRSDNLEANQKADRKRMDKADKRMDDADAERAGDKKKLAKLDEQEKKIADLENVVRELKQQVAAQQNPNSGPNNSKVEDALRVVQCQVRALKGQLTKDRNQRKQGKMAADPELEYRPDPNVFYEAYPLLRNGKWQRGCLVCTRFRLAKQCNGRCNQHKISADTPLFDPSKFDPAVELAYDKYPELLNEE
ncbi:hypothetical protein MPSEU_000423700 [Mayamaea pseudoterrestris]|nr:hypothetical protein MPSEU_000423700 [Mayamaea pseudoterrestris]